LHNILLLLVSVLGASCFAVAIVLQCLQQIADKNSLMIQYPVFQICILAMIFSIILLIVIGSSSKT
jgi:uncharacterized membrane protein required for colicin V production